MVDVYQQQQGALDEQDYLRVWYLQTKIGHDRLFNTKKEAEFLMVTF